MKSLNHGACVIMDLVIRLRIKLLTVLQAKLTSLGTNIYFDYGGKRVEIDVVTSDALIQAKRGLSALEKPKNFLNQKNRAQIKRTVKLANEQNKTAQFYFKYGVHPQVRSYIVDKGGIVKTGLGD